MLTLTKTDKHNKTKASKADAQARRAAPAPPQQLLR